MQNEAGAGALRTPRIPVSGERALLGSHSSPRDFPVPETRGPGLSCSSLCAWLVIIDYPSCPQVLWFELGILECFGMGGTIKTLSHRQGHLPLLQDAPTWPCTLPGMGQSQILWAEGFLSWTLCFYCCFWPCQDDAGPEKENSSVLQQNSSMAGSRNGEENVIDNPYLRPVKKPKIRRKK